MSKFFAKCLSSVEEIVETFSPKWRSENGQCERPCNISYDGQCEQPRDISCGGQCGETCGCDRSYSGSYNAVIMIPVGIIDAPILIKETLSKFSLQDKI